MFELSNNSSFKICTMPDRFHPHRPYRITIVQLLVLIVLIVGIIFGEFIVLTLIGYRGIPNILIGTLVGYVFGMLIFESYAKYRL